MNHSAVEQHITLSIVILSYNGMAHLPECIGSIERQNYSDYEILIVDNASTDESVEWIRSSCPMHRLIQSKSNRGFCAGMNLGLAQASGKYVLFLNQDTILESGCLAALVDTITQQTQDVIGVFPKVVFNAAPLFINAFGVNWYESCHWRDSRVGLPDLGQFKSPQRVFGSIFPAVLFRRDSFVEIGAFDELFWSYCEDFDVCYRTALFGYSLVTAPYAVIRHKYRSSSKDTTNPLWSRFWFVRNYLLVFLKNYELKSLWQHRRVIFMRYFGHSFLDAWRHRRVSEISMYLRVVGSLFLRLPYILKRRFFIQLHRKKRDAEIWQRSVIEEHNIYHVDGCIVLSIKSLRAATKDESFQYRIGDQTYHSI